jgi:hypothetical protein
MAFLCLWPQLQHAPFGFVGMNMQIDRFVTDFKSGPPHGGPLRNDGNMKIQKSISQNALYSTIMTSAGVNALQK